MATVRERRAHNGGSLLKYNRAKLGARGVVFHGARRRIKRTAKGSLMGYLISLKMS